MAIEKLETLVEQLIGDNIENAFQFFRKFKIYGDINIIGIDPSALSNPQPPQVKNTKFYLNVQAVIYEIIRDNSPYKSLLEKIRTAEDVQEVFNTIFRPYTWLNDESRLYEGHDAELNKILNSAIFGITCVPFSVDCTRELPELWAASQEDGLFRLSGSLRLDHRYVDKIHEQLRKQWNSYEGFRIMGHHFGFPGYVRCLGFSDVKQGEKQ